MNVRFLACRFYDYCNGDCTERMDDLCGQWPDIHIDKIDRMAADREDCIIENIQGLTGEKKDKAQEALRRRHGRVGRVA